MSQLSILQTYAGKHIPAIQRIKLFSPVEWEEFVEEWLTTKQKQYSSINRLGGAGDKGRDVVGIKKNETNNPIKWDNYQCKHYDHALMPSDVWCEFGKLCYYTYISEFSIPDKYFFVAPFGVGTTLSNLLESPEKLKSELIKNWDRYCKEKITNTKNIVLEGAFLAYMENFDYSIFDKITPLSIIEEHQKTPYYIGRFGGGMPERPSIPPCPQEISESELPYINKLLAAYSSDSGDIFISTESLQQTKYIGHLNRTRESFFSAEQLKMFSRDRLPPKVFEDLKDEIYFGTIDIYEENHNSGFDKVKSVEQEARRLAITSNALTLCCTVKDKTGICHHLANEEKFKWVKE